ncbi:hypothetical protein [Natrialba swarupiae]|uniref:Uncharacterized protein n=1 Tax=Natrialba swarupiae TaxID=2448032 RepID=A0A5D5ATR5_9EURY|nr:hypothetical protein [Natrialba swarupiae]TYT62940.1 hypothetical protein FYC77_06410 [Natrialba swarupiae]
MQRRALHAAIAVAVGIAHAALVVGVAIRLGYGVGPTLAAPLESAVRYGGLIALGAVPIWLALEDRLVVPVLVVGLLAGLALYWELTPPAPTFQDVAEIEPAIDEPTGHTVVSDGLYLTRYVSAWYAWLVGTAVVGFWEHVVRTRSTWLPDPAWDVPVPTDRRTAGVLAVSVGIVHAFASVRFATGWGMTDSAATITWAAIGGVVVLAVPVYLLVRHELSLPTAVTIGLFVNSVHSQQHVSGPGDPYVLYVGMWVVVLGIALFVGALEYGVGRLWTRRSGGSSATT